MIYKAVKKIPADEYRNMRQCLNGMIPMGEDDTISITIPFTPEIEIDVKICGSKNEKPWVEAVLFKNGSEVCCSDVEDNILGTWFLSDGEDKYFVFLYH